MFVTHLESAIDGTRFEPNRVMTMHEGRPLWVRYDLAAVKNAVNGSGGRPPSCACGVTAYKVPPISTAIINRVSVQRKSWMRRRANR